MLHGVGVLLILVYFIVVTIFLTILWHIAASLDVISRTLSDIAQDVKKISDKSEK